MRIACCTIEMVALIFLLFVSINGGLNYVDTARTDLVSKPSSEMVTAWGTPDSVIDAREVGLVSARLAEVEIWSYANPERSVVIRDDIVISIRWG